MKSDTGPAPDQRPDGVHQVGSLYNRNTGVFSHLHAEFKDGKATGKYHVTHYQAAPTGLHQYAGHSFSARSAQDLSNRFRGAHNFIANHRAAVSVARGGPAPEGGTFHPFKGQKLSTAGTGGGSLGQARNIERAASVARSRQSNLQRVAGRVTHEADMSKELSGLKMPGAVRPGRTDSNPWGRVISSGMTRAANKSGLIFGSHHEGTGEFVAAHSTGDGNFQVHHFQTGPRGHVVTHSISKFDNRRAALEHAAKLTTGGFGGKAAGKIASGVHPGKLDGKVEAWNRLPKEHIDAMPGHFQKLAGAKPLSPLSPVKPAESIQSPSRSGIRLQDKDERAEASHGAVLRSRYPKDRSSAKNSGYAEGAGRSQHTEGRAAPEAGIDPAGHRTDAGQPRDAERTFAYPYGRTL